MQEARGEEARTQAAHSHTPADRDPASDTSSHTRPDRVGNCMDIVDVVDQNTCVVSMTPYEVEIVGFKKSVLEKSNPYCDARMSLRAAAMALLGLEAMEKQQRIVVPQNILA